MMHPVVFEVWLTESMQMVVNVWSNTLHIVNHHVFPPKRRYS